MLLRIFFFFLLTLDLSSQTKSYPKDYFANPIDSTISLSGNFGELRPNHFHAGLDFRLPTGRKIYCAAEGYVSRIKVSTVGYGKVIYVTHPNGYSTVYAHLSKFHGKIDSFVKAHQYEEQSYEVELFPYPEDLTLEKGELIAFSGNTGGSSGPHLHFEIRNAANDVPINPLLFGLPVNDAQPPVFKTLAIYPRGGGSIVNGKNKVLKRKIKKGKSGFVIDTRDSLTASGFIGFGVEVADRETRGKSDNGVFSIELLVNGRTIYNHVMEKFSFSESRYVNAHVDYSDKYFNNSKIQRSFQLKNDKLSIYRKNENRGVIEIKPDSVYKIQYIISDASGNTSRLSFTVRGKKVADSETENKALVPSEKVIERKTENALLTIPAFSFYEDVSEQDCKLSVLKKEQYGPRIKAGNSSVPIHENAILRIRPYEMVDSLKVKLVIYSVSKGGGIQFQAGNMNKEGWLETRIKTLGEYGVTLDTIPPRIRFPFSPSKTKSAEVFTIKKGKSVNVFLDDNFSGVSSFNVLLNGNWILAEYEPKEKLLFVNLPDDLAGGGYSLEISAKDAAGNVSKKNFAFNYSTAN